MNAESVSAFTLWNFMSRAFFARNVECICGLPKFLKSQKGQKVEGKEEGVRILIQYRQVLE